MTSCRRGRPDDRCVDMSGDLRRGPERSESCEGRQRSALSNERRCPSGSTTVLSHPLPTGDRCVRSRCPEGRCRKWCIPEGGRGSYHPP